MEKGCGGGGLRRSVGKSCRSVAHSTLTVNEYYILDIIRIDPEVQDSRGDSANVLRLSAGGHLGRWGKKATLEEISEGGFVGNWP